MSICVSYDQLAILEGRLLDNNLGESDRALLVQIIWEMRRMRAKLAKDHGQTTNLAERRGGEIMKPSGDIGIRPKPTDVD